MSNRKLYIFDLCNTLYDSNTTFDFIYYFLKSDKNYVFRKIIFSLIVSRSTPIFYLLVVFNKIFQRDFHRVFAIKLLVEVEKNVLYQSADLYVKNELIKHENIEVIELFKIVSKEKESDVKIVSSSIDPIVSCVAKYLNVNFICSELSYKNGVCQGKFSNDISGEKEKYLDINTKDVNENLTVISDNFSDKELLKLAAFPIVVINKPNDHVKWDDLNPRFIKTWL